ncbi:polysialoglycoprotein-like [Salvelinus fontinalis]|uniref:polysialoglycoprotein-like n=1 Tax=Salvelinus fontinalis TaxID=8038 RepID=UPI002484F42E|nr:polysialoglycoprotein-like [Salvelinus fontinalis]
MIMGGVRELLLFVMTVGVVKVSCYLVGKSQKQDQVSLQRRLGELSSNDASIVHALALLRSIGSDAKQDREEYLETKYNPKPLQTMVSLQQMMTCPLRRS